MSNKKPTINIAKFRQKKGLTQLELSQLVGVRESTIANWEHGRSGFDWFEKLARLCKTLECDLEDLIGDVEVVQPAHPIDKWQGRGCKSKKTSKVKTEKTDSVSS